MTAKLSRREFLAVGTAAPALLTTGLANEKNGLRESTRISIASPGRKTRVSRITIVLPTVRRHQRRLSIF